MILGIELNWVFFRSMVTLFSEYIIVFLFYTNFLGQEYSNRLKNILGAFSYILVISLLFIFFGSIEATRMLLALLTYILIAFFLFDGKWYWKLLKGFLFFAIMHLLDLLTMFGLMWIANANAQEIFVGSEALYLCGVIISRVLLLLTTQILGHFRNKENKHMSFEYWIAIITLPAISSFVVYLIFEFNWRLQSTEVTMTTLIALFGILYINIFAFRLIKFFANKTERDTKDAVIKKNFEKQVEECKRLEYLIASRADFFHDIKHHKRTLERLVAEIDINGAMDIFREILKLEAMQIKEYVSTHNNVVNALFNYHITYAERMGIRVDVGDVYFPQNFNVDIADLCSIFGNSLENAVEACMRITEGDKFIKIGLRYRDNDLVYRITNSTDGKVVKEPKWFSSTKVISGLSGLGLEIMENAVNKYNGMFSAEHKDNVFEVCFFISRS